MGLWDQFQLRTWGSQSHSASSSSCDLLGPTADNGSLISFPVCVLGIIIVIVIIIGIVVTIVTITTLVLVKVHLIVSETVSSQLQLQP